MSRRSVSTAVRGLTEASSHGRPRRVVLVSMGFPGRDLALGPVSLESFALRDPVLASRLRFDIRQYGLDASAELSSATLEDVFVAVTLKPPEAAS